MYGEPLLATGRPLFGLFGPIGWTELVIILFLVLLFFGPKRLPELAESIGKAIHRFRKASRDARSEIETSVGEKHSEGKDKQG